MTRFILFINKKSNDFFLALRTYFFFFFYKFSVSSIVAFFYELYKEIEFSFLVMQAHRTYLKNLDDKCLKAGDPNGWLVCYYIAYNQRWSLMYGFVLAVTTTMFFDLVYPWSSDRLGALHETQAVIEVAHQHLQEPQVPTTPEQAKEISHLKIRIAVCVAVTAAGFIAAILSKAAYEIPKGFWS